MAKYLSTKELNVKLDEIRKAGLKPITEYGYTFQDYDFSRIIKPLALKGGGKIMSYKESVEFIEKYARKPIIEGTSAHKKYGNFSGTWTYKEYRKTVKKFIDQYSERLSVEGEQNIQIKYMQQTLKDMFENVGDRNITIDENDDKTDPYNYSRLTYEELKEAFREASELQKVRGDRKQPDSGKRFYADLNDAIRRLQGLNGLQEDYDERLIRDLDYVL